MSCKATIREIGGVAVVDLSGRIVLGDGSQVVRETVRGLLSAGRKLILLNLGDVNYIDSAGLGELVGSYVTTLNQGGSLKLLNPLKRVGDLLQITKLTTVFECFEDEARAIGSFQSLAAEA